MCNAYAPKLWASQDKISGLVLLLKLLLNEDNLYKLISEAKKERIDKQYYMTTEKDDINKEIADELLKYAEDYRPI